MTPLGLPQRLIGVYTSSVERDLKMRKTTILLANDQNVIRQSLRRRLESEADFEMVGDVGNALDAVRLADEFKPDIIIMEARMPGLSSAEATKQIKARHPQSAVLILTMDEDEEYIIELMAAGAAGYLLKTADIEELLQAIRSMRTGELVISRTVGQKLVKHMARTQAVAVDYGQHLTPREFDVLKLTARGLSNEKIADQLGIGTRTVRQHLMNIYAKMGVSSRMEAVSKALREGWIGLDTEERNREAPKRRL